MKKDIWLIMGGAILMITLVIIVIQLWVITALLHEYKQVNMLMTTYQASGVVSPSATTVSTGVEEEPTPTPSSQSPIATSVPPTDTPVMPTAALTATPTPTATPTLSPDTAWSKLAPFDQRMQEFDEWVKQTQAQRLETDECRAYIGEASGECWMYPIGMGNVILVEGYTYLGPSVEVDVYAYDFDGDGQPEILKWDLDRDGGFDIIEYDVDGDSVCDFALADMNDNGQFDEDEIYMYESTTGIYLPLIPGHPPFSFSLIFPY